MIGVVEANPRITTAELDGIRADAQEVASGLSPGVTVNTAVHNEATFDGPAVDHARQRDELADSIVVFGWNPAYFCRRIATVGEWLGRTADERRQLVDAATREAVRPSTGRC